MRQCTSSIWTGDEAKKVLDATDDGAETLFETSVSCIGATICQVGLRDSQGLLHKVIEAEREAGLRMVHCLRFIFLDVCLLAEHIRLERSDSTEV